MCPRAMARQGVAVAASMHRRRHLAARWQPSPRWLRLALSALRGGGAHVERWGLASQVDEVVAEAVAVAIAWRR